MWRYDSHFHFKGNEVDLRLRSGGHQEVQLKVCVCGGGGGKVWSHLSATKMILAT